MSQQQESSLWESYERVRSIENRNALVLFYYRLVHKIAYKLCRKFPNTIDVGDLVSSGVLGLIESVERYDSTKGVYFNSFCGLRIVGAMLDSIRQCDLLSKLFRKRCSDIIKFVDWFLQEHQRQPTPVEIAERTEFSEEQIQECLEMLQASSTVSCEVIVREDSKMVCLRETFAGNEIDPYITVEKRDSIRHLAKGCNQVEKDILLEYYYERGENLTLKQIGEKYNVSESRISQIHTQLLVRLREAYNEERVRNLL